MEDTFQECNKPSTATTLDLSHTRLDAAACTALAISLTQLSNLTTLNLSYNPLDAGACTALAPGLAQLHKLTTLDLSSGGLNAQACKALAPSLAKLPSLTTLNLGNNQLGSAACTSLAPSLAALSNLTYLELGWNKLGTAAFIALAPSLAKLSNLTALDLRCNKLDAAACTSLAPSLAALSNLTYLELGWNKLGTAAFIALAPSLAKLSNLTTLDLSGTLVGDLDYLALAPSLAPLIKLTFIFVDCSVISWKFSLIVKRNQQIQSIIKYINNALKDSATNNIIDTRHNELMSKLDQLRQIAEKINSKYNLMPTVLYDTYYHLACRVALTYNDIDAAINAADSMSTFPWELLQPHANPDNPPLCAKLIRLVANDVTSADNMQKMSQILLQIDTSNILEQNNRHRLQLLIARSANPAGIQPEMNSFNRLINSQDPQRPDTIIAYEHLLVTAEGLCNRHPGSPEATALRQNLEQASSYSLINETQLLNNPLVRAYFEQQANKPVYIVTYERLIHTSDTDNNVATPRDTSNSDLRESLLQLASVFELTDLVNNLKAQIEALPNNALSTVAKFADQEIITDYMNLATNRSAKTSPEQKQRIIDAFNQLLQRYTQSNQPVLQTLGKALAILGLLAIAAGIALVLLTTVPAIASALFLKSVIDATLFTAGVASLAGGTAATVGGVAMSFFAAPTAIVRDLQKTQANVEDQLTMGLTEPSQQARLPSKTSS